jgi:hypothetical protein
MESELSMRSRAEVTSRFARGYVQASKKERGQILDQGIEVTGWSRDNARRRLVAAATRPGKGRAVAVRERKPRALKYSYDALKVLQKVWAASGGQCGKYLAVSMPVQLAALERHGELVVGEGRYSESVREELLSMSAATIDRYLKPAKANDQISGVSTTKPSVLLRNSIKVRKAGDEAEAEPGFFEGDTVAHCARTLNLTDVHTGWVFTRSIRNNAHTHILSGLKTAITEISYAVTSLDFDNGSEFLNQPVITWAGNEASTSPDPGRTRRTTRPPSNRRTTTSSASTRSTGAMTPTPNAPFSTRCGLWSTTASTT